MANPKTPNLNLNKVDRSSPTTTTFNTKPIIDDNADIIDGKFGAAGHTHDGTAGNGPKIGTNGIADGAVTAAKVAADVATQGELDAHIALTSAHGATSAATANTIVKRDASGNFTGNVLVSSVAPGTAPFTVASSTKVVNLNADFLDDQNATISANANTIVSRDSNADITTRRFISSASTGTAPFTVTSTTKVTNLNADWLDDLSAGNGSGGIPISNGTLNTNLNADMLDGYHAAVSQTANTIVQRDANGRAKISSPVDPDHIARKDTVDTEVAKALPKAGGTMTGNPIINKDSALVVIKPLTNHANGDGIDFLKADGTRKWLLFHRASNNEFGIYDAINNKMGFSIDPSGSFANTAGGKIWDTAQLRDNGGVLELYTGGAWKPVGDIQVGIQRGAVVVAASHTAWTTVVDLSGVSGRIDKASITGSNEAGSLRVTIDGVAETIAMSGSVTNAEIFYLQNNDLASYAPIYFLNSLKVEVIKEVVGANTVMGRVSYRLKLGTP